MVELLRNPYLIMAFLGGIACLLTQYYNFTQEGFSFKIRIQVLGLTFLCIIVGAIASLFGYWQNTGILKLPPNEWLEHVGLTAYHGMIAAWGLFCLGSRIIGLNIRKASSIAAPCIVIFFAFGRVGCSLVGCCYGRPVNLEFLGYEFYTFPSAQLEVAFFLMLFVALQLFIKKRRTVTTILSYNIFRFLNEYLRGDDRGALIPGIPLSPAQIISLSLTVIVICWVAYPYIKGAYQRRHAVIKCSEYGNGGER